MITTGNNALQFHKEAIVVDAHHDILIDVLYRRQRGERAVFQNYWLPKMQKGGIDVQVLPIYIDTNYLPEMALRRGLQLAEAFHSDLQDDSSLIAQASSYSDVDRIVKQGKIAAILAMEGTEPLGSDLEMLNIFYRLGVRCVSLTWNRRTMFADGTGEIGTRGGLTELGFAAIKAMDRMNMLIDLSHLSETGFYDIMDTTKNPVIASHSNCQGIFDHPRNLSDRQIKLLAENGGVMGLLLHPAMIDPHQPTLSRAVDHIAYVADLVGIDHIGLGTDFIEGFILDASNNPANNNLMDEALLKSTVQGCGSLEELPNFTMEMSKRGFSSKDIKKVLGENFLRVFKQVLV